MTAVKPTSTRAIHCEDLRHIFPRVSTPRIAQGGLLDAKKPRPAARDAAATSAFCEWDGYCVELLTALATD